jgi:hypothetical protein
MASGLHALQKSIGGSVIASFRRLAPLLARYRDARILARYRDARKSLATRRSMAPICPREAKAHQRISDCEQPVSRRSYLMDFSKSFCYMRGKSEARAIAPRRQIGGLRHITARTQQQKE